MGLFDRKRAKENEGNSIEPPREGKVEVKFPIVTVVVEEILSMTASEVSIIGNVHGGVLKENDRLYILGRNGKSIPTVALRLKDTMMTKMTQAEDGMNVSILLDGVSRQSIEKFDVLSSVNCITSELDSPDTPVNPYLSGLLREAKAHQKETDFMGRIMEYIANTAVFLTPCMHEASEEGKEDKVGYALLKSKDDKMYMSAFTDVHELESLNGLPGKMLEPVDFEKVMNVIHGAPVEGLLINPAHEGFVLKKNLLESLALQKRKIINNVRDQKIDTNQPVALAVPKEDHIPTELFEALRQYMTNEPSILRAWYGVMLFPKENKRSHLIIIDTLEETPEIFGAIGRTAKPFLDEDMPLNMQAASKVGQMTEKLMMFYERKDEINTPL